MPRQRHKAVFAPLALDNMEDLAVEIQITQAHAPYFHAAQPAAVEQPDKHAVFEQRGVVEHRPHLLFAQHDGDFLFAGNGRKAQIIVRQSLRFQQEAKSVNSVFEITL